MFTLYAARLGNEAVGITCDPRQIRTARWCAAILHLDGARFRENDLRNLDEYAGTLGQFDQVIVFETIEHIKNDRKLLSDLAALLRPSGMLLLTAPSKHHRSLWGETISETEDGGHVRWGYTHEEMRNLFQMCGLEVVVEEYVSGLVSQKLASLQFALIQINTLLAWALTFPLRVFHGLDGPLTRLALSAPEHRGRRAKGGMSALGFVAGDGRANPGVS